MTKIDFLNLIININLNSWLLFVMLQIGNSWPLFAMLQMRKKNSVAGTGRWGMGADIGPEYFKFWGASRKIFLRARA